MARRHLAQCRDVGLKAGFHDICRETVARVRLTFVPNPDVHLALGIFSRRHRFDVEVGQLVLDIQRDIDRLHQGINRPVALGIT